MFRYIIKKLKFLNRIFRSQKYRSRDCSQTVRIRSIPKSIKEVQLFYNKKFSNCFNFSMREFPIGNYKKLLLMYMEGLINSERLELCVIRPILEMAAQAKENIVYMKRITPDYLKNSILYPVTIAEIDDMEKAPEYLYYGFIILFVENESKALCIKISEATVRNLSKPEVENSIRGPKEALGENAFVNLLLLTNYIKNPDFKSEKLILGERTNTELYICYLKGVAREEIVDKVKSRLEKIYLDSMVDINYLNEYISDNPFTLFPLTGSHERPDVVAAQILEGRIAILCNGSPFAITVPHLFIENIQNSEDYFDKPVFATFVRIIRFTAFVLSFLLPALYIAFLNFEHQVTPFELLVTAAAGQEKTPMSSISEALMMILSFEILREATIRMPKGVGQTVSIVGALVLGEAAVKAGFTSNLMVIVLALTAICSYLNITLQNVGSLYRLAYIIIANIFGFAGIVFLSALICFHMCSLTSLDMPYMSPLAPYDPQGAKDTLVRFPLKSMKSRPKGIAKDRKRRA